MCCLNVSLHNSFTQCVRRARHFRLTVIELHSKKHSQDTPQKSTPQMTHVDGNADYERLGPLLNVFRTNVISLQG